ncbi:N-acetylmuramic acid 6-phosphate etherase [bacterium (Candidatus Blackallbacteria) CG17_big_fil_post_rev_8_21_14_2_50_48_46]|uniref:N-acetylmuramic acid 6-phosphate etherase n=1 Tax=bacterium (Candidatus Blackallbacteria) CG17_big_fil_post_rev_8_21_14_2_50_48_46 TaxID=2014261 RepID=A0A2M7G5C6_9BACT|nr:MAG: N-acetylmuramic acid 6-phosphate etherase [bacterium (Candidatus Blackallbacteria) CG18_big_fil_WC_8_21_14_2_50_49_26]PIW16763.1 MAG: N-acetylmuramic acid 6-phosphate etherase [bacterium (Candidatus Blackallbacteria) CG17_big_fil_post_rev_8_21_14_2_50_48_46]PIW49555.1 MAG: N-acetylmuramic acid 6-phosphate etherase [bacterium (Candidatus Blackallbacteria) CG13_big_fil_rev_8_21_14_2_50_49_14]
MSEVLPLTERANPRSQALDSLSIAEIIALMRAEDQSVLAAFEPVLKPLEQLIETVVACLRAGGRLIYMGAGTSGRLGVLDAAECPPTFRTPPGLVVGLIAGGEKALQNAVEGAEDSLEGAQEDLLALALQPQDIVIGIAASGSTPYVRAGLRFARAAGAHTALLSCTSLPTEDVAIEHTLILAVGPEIITGSTRLKAGTVTKLALNMISTISMIQLGKVYGHYMVDVTISNAKLKRRAQRMIQELTGLDETKASDLLEQAQGEVKTALMMHLGQFDADTARQRLALAAGHLRRALEGAPS